MHCAYGQLIHNDDVTDDLEKRGLPVLDSITDIKPGMRIIIRAHGISKSEQDEILRCGAEIIDATCPYVKKIHKIVNEAYSRGRTIIICGNKEHPEVVGINGWCENQAVVVGSDDDISQMLESDIEKPVTCLLYTSKLN